MVIITLRAFKFVHNIDYSNGIFQFFRCFQNVRYIFYYLFFSKTITVLGKR